MGAPSRTEPVFFVKVAGKGGERIDLSDRVLSFTFEESVSKTDKLTLSVDNWDLSNFDNPVWMKGQILEVSWGYPGNMAPTRQVVIQKVTGFQVLQIEGLDKSVLMNKLARTETYENMTYSAIVRKIAERNGYGRDVQHIDETDFVDEHVVQGAMTDAQMLAHLAHKTGRAFWVDDLGLHWLRVNFDQPPIRTLRWYTPPEVGEIISINIENDVTAKHGEVVAKGRDPIAKRDIAVTANNRETLRRTTAKALEIFGVQDIVANVISNIVVNPDILAKNIGSALQKLPKIAKVPPPKPNANAAKVVPAKPLPKPTPQQVKAFQNLVHVLVLPEVLLRTASKLIQVTPFASHAPAKDKADGTWLAGQQRTVELTATVLGDPLLLCKTTVEFQGISQRLSGPYYIHATKHTIDSGGYLVELKCRRDGTSEKRGVPSLGQFVHHPTPSLTPAQLEVAKQVLKTVRSIDDTLQHVLPAPLGRLVDGALTQVFRPVLKFKDTRGRPVQNPPKSGGKP